jgi:uncharacterized phiE125 gp8 family phage protein
MALLTLVEPQYLPVTLTQVKQWLRIDDDIIDQDEVLTLLIRTMTRYAENRTGRAFMQRQLRLVLPAAQTFVIEGAISTGFELPMPPLVSVELITYIDADGIETVLSAEDYDVLFEFTPSYVVPSYQVTWPSTRASPRAWQIDYTAGYAAGSPGDETDQQTAMPPQFVTWMHARIATLYEQREQIITGTIVATLPHAFADGLLDDLIVGRSLF